MAGIDERVANLHSDEGTVFGTKTVTFPWASAKIIATNDSGTTDLGIQIGANTLTLKPTETVTVWLRARRRHPSTSAFRPTTTGTGTSRGSCSPLPTHRTSNSLSAYRTTFLRA